MDEHGVRIGPRIGPFDGRLDQDLLRRFAGATKDRSPSVQAGEAVPPTGIVTQIWQAQNASRDRLVPAGLRGGATGGVHGEHDIVLHRPIVPGERLVTWVEGHGARPAGRNSLVTLRYVTSAADGSPVAEQWWTTVWLGVRCRPAGVPAPDHSVPSEARDRPVGTWEEDVDAGMAARYAEVSGDHSAHHFDVEAARRSGFQRIFLHGMCTMALCARAVVEVVADGEPERVRRLAVRFAAPVFLGEQLHVRLYDAGPSGWAFEADSGGAAVITQGRAVTR